MSANRAEQSFSISAAEGCPTLVSALRGRLPGKSWSELRKVIGARRVLVNGAVCLDDARRLAAGDTIQVLAQPLPAAGERQVQIHFVDRYLVVAEKPPRMMTLRHWAERDWPTERKARQPALDETLARLLAPSGRGRKREARPADLCPVHRIDRDTSGLLVFARDQQTQQALIARFARHDVQRAYLAIAWGAVPAATLDSQLVRDRGDGLRGSTADPAAGKRAVTHVQPLERFGEHTLVECRLETGRTHQIRIQLAELGHPLCGDNVYRGPLGAAPLPDHSGAPRLALHAAVLGFSHPVTGQDIVCRSPLPPDLQQFLERLRSP